MRLGVHLMGYQGPQGPPVLAAELAAAGSAADAAGLSWLSVMDHYFQVEWMGRPEDAMLECYTTLGFLAAHTSSVQLGVLVTGVTYRHPGLLAKIVTTLDVLSGGRATLGIGAAMYEREHLGLGVPFPPTAERFERLEETIQICLQMWDPRNDGPFEGKHYQLAETLCAPSPVSEPRPEIMIGGSGEKKTVKLMAQYADTCNFTVVGIDDVAHKLDVLRRHCDDAGRDFAQIRKTAMYAGPSLGNGELDAFATEIERYAALDIDTVIVSTPAVGAAQFIDDCVGPAVRRVAELG